MLFRKAPLESQPGGLGTHKLGELVSLSPSGGRNGWGEEGPQPTSAGEEGVQCRSGGLAPLAASVRGPSVALLS